MIRIIHLSYVRRGMKIVLLIMVIIFDKKLIGTRTLDNMILVDQIIKRKVVEKQGL